MFRGEWRCAVVLRPTLAPPATSVRLACGTNTVGIVSSASATTTVTPATRSPESATTAHTTQRATTAIVAQMDFMVNPGVNQTPAVRVHVTAVLQPVLLTMTGVSGSARIARKVTRGGTASYVRTVTMATPPKGYHAGSATAAATLILRSREIVTT